MPTGPPPLRSQVTGLPDSSRQSGCAAAVGVGGAEIADRVASARRLTDEHARRSPWSARAAAARPTARGEAAVEEGDSAVGRRASAAAARRPFRSWQPRSGPTPRTRRGSVRWRSCTRPCSNPRWSRTRRRAARRTTTPGTCCSSRVRSSRPCWRSRRCQSWSTPCSAVCTCRSCRKSGCNTDCSRCRAGCPIDTRGSCRSRSRSRCCNSRRRSCRTPRAAGSSRFPDRRRRRPAKGWRRRRCRRRRRGPRRPPSSCPWSPRTRRSRPYPRARQAPLHNKGAGSFRTACMGHHARTVPWRLTVRSRAVPARRYPTNWRAGASSRSPALSPREYHSARLVAVVTISVIALASLNSAGGCILLRWCLRRELVQWMHQLPMEST